MNTTNKQSRTYNSFKNVYYGLLITIINTILSFISRTVFLKFLGNSILSINSLFSEVIAMMSLAELGIGMSIVYHLYKPLVENDLRRISQLMTLYKKMYNIIAILMIIIGIILFPFIHLIVNDLNFSTQYIQMIFIFFVIRTSISYIYSYKSSLLNADQKQYIVSLINTIMQVIFTICMVLLLYLTGNYILYLVLNTITVFSGNFIVSKYVDRIYPDIKYNLAMDKIDKKEIFLSVKNIFIKRVSGQITTSTDNILISTLVSTLQVGFYSNYNMVFSVVRTVKSQLTKAFTASIGNLLVTESSNKCISILKRLTYIYMIFGLVMTSGLIVLIDDFIKLWIGSKYIMESSIIFIAICNLYIEILCEPIWQFLEVSGLFSKDKNIAIIGSSANLIVSVIFGKLLGISGIFLGTIFSQLIQLILKTIILFQYKFDENARVYLILIFKYFIMFILNSFLAFKIMIYVDFNNIVLSFLIKGTLAGLIPLLLVYLFFRKTEEFVYMKKIIIQFIKKIKK